MDMALWQRIIDEAGAGNLSRWVEDACIQKLNCMILRDAAPEKASPENRIPHSPASQNQPKYPKGTKRRSSA
jgi:hypothetical protein